MRAIHERLTRPAPAHVTAERVYPEIMPTSRSMERCWRQLQEVVIRYLFYYPNELGAHSHVHDLESVELRIVIEEADERGDPRASNALCRQIRVATLYGAAHGLGLYTNVLDLDVVLLDRLDETTQVSKPRAGAPGGLRTGRRCPPRWPTIAHLVER